MKRKDRTEIARYFARGVDGILRIPRPRWRLYVVSMPLGGGLRRTSGRPALGGVGVLAVAALALLVGGSATAVAGRTSPLPGGSGAVTAKILPLPTGHSSTEANVAIDPTDPRDVLVVARDESVHNRLVGLRMWRSRDGGRTFKDGMFLDRRLDGAPADGGNPVALFDTLGRPAPVFLALRWGKSKWQTRIMLGRRTVVRAEYGPPFPTLGNIYGPRKWYDKPWGVIDPVSGLAHVSWTVYWETKSGPVEKVAIARALPGKPFPKARVLGSGSGSQPVLGRGSTVLVVWYQQPNLSPRARILSSRSRDGGVTWSVPRVVASGINVHGYPPFPTVVRAGSGFVACWQQYAGWRVRVACSRSPSGSSWSRPRVVAQPPGAGDAFEPALAASPDGRLWLAFYRLTRGSTSVELWNSSAGTERWQRRAVLMRRAVPGTELDFLGDYQGLAVTRNRVIAAFTMPVRAHAFRQVVEVARFSTGR